jgi:hypothetical protein
MIGLTSQIRIGLVATYVALILLGVAALRIMFLHYNGAVHPALGIIAIGSHALPLLLTKFLQDLLFGGPEPNGQGALIFLAVIATQWSPILALSIAPRSWARRGMRRLTIAYFAAILTLDFAAAVWLAIDSALLAS